MPFLKKLFSVLVIMNICNPIPLVSHEREIDAIVNQALEEFHVPGAAVAVVVGDEILLCRGYGMRDVDVVDPLVKFTFFSNSLGEMDELHVPFEHFRAAPPIIFRK